ncbi:MAG TPA: serine--tRNA ligase [Bacillota bacterium]|nr:serine--tRNA ligase [Bacillota bacterium]
MIDIKLVRENPKVIKESIKKRLQDGKSFDSLLKIDTEWKKAKKDIDELRGKRNKISQEINEAKKRNQDIKVFLKEAREIPKEIQKKETLLRSLEGKRLELWKKIPNLIDKSVPVGDATKNKVLKKYGTIKKKKIKEGHAEILENSELIDTKKAAQVTGSRFYYLRKDLVRLNYAIINFTLDFFSKKKFELIQPPTMLKKDALEGAITFDVFEDAIYKIEGEDLYLIGTAEHSINAFKSNEILNLNELPLRFAGISSCFRKEAGAHGKDTKGIFRVHQFEKVEQFVFCRPENSWKEFDFILKNSIELYKKLEIPFRVVVLASGDTGNTATKTVDLEGWYPSQKKYRELGSCSNCLDYQARRSNIRFQEGGEIKFVHTLNNTAIATERMMTCIVENHIQKDGSIKIPKALQKYMNRQKIIKKKKKL